eukprot:gene5987-12332_t
MHEAALAADPCFREGEWQQHAAGVDMHPDEFPRSLPPLVRRKLAAAIGRDRSMQQPAIAAARAKMDA